MRIAPLGVFVGCAAVLPAQPILDATFVAATALVVETHNHFFGGQRRAAPPGTDLRSGFTLDAQGPGGFARFTTRYRHDVDALRAEIVDEGSCGWVTYSRCGQHDTRLFVRARQPTRAKLVVSAGAATTPRSWSNPTWSGRVDIGDDGTYEVDTAVQPGVSEFVVDLDPAGLAIRTTTYGFAYVGDSSTVATYAGILTLEVVPLVAPVVEVVAATDIRVSWGFDGGLIRAGTGLRPQAALRYPSSSPPVSFLAEARVDDGRVEVVLSETGQSSFTTASTGPHDVAVVLRSPVAMAVHVALEVHAQCTVPASDWSGQIDLGDDGSFEVQSTCNGSVRYEAVVPVGAAGLRIRTRSRGAASNASFAGQLRISITPALRCTFSSYGPTCGPTLTGQVVLQDVLDLRLAGGRSDSICKLLLGVNRTDQPLPFSPCRLLVEPLLAIPFATDAAGQARQRLRVPPGVLPALVAQNLVLLSSSPLGLQATPGLAVSCP